MRRLELAPIGKRIRERLLTETERQQLAGPGGNTQDPHAALGAFNGNGGLVRVWMHLRGVSQPRAIADLAEAVNLLSEAEYLWLDREIRSADPMLTPGQREAKRPRRRRDDPDERLARARDKYPLVLVCGGGEHRVYWRGELVDAPWGQNPMVWEFLWMLADAATRGAVVRWDVLTGATSDDVIKHRRHRLKTMLPADPNHLIEPGGEPRSYKLRVQPSEIKLIELRRGECLFSGR